MATFGYRALHAVVALAIMGSPSLVRAAEAQAPADPQPAAVADDAPSVKLPVKEQNGISYVSGGVGDEEQDALEHAKGFNLELTMASTSGKYVGVTDLRIDDAQGKKVLEVQTDGPLFLAKLPSGEYVVHATAQGASTTRKVSVPGSGRERVTLSWSAGTSHEPPDGADPQ
jgi:hypothetical protein